MSGTKTQLEMADEIAGYVRVPVADMVRASAPERYFPAGKLCSMSPGNSTACKETGRYLVVEWNDDHAVLQLVERWPT